MVEWCCSKPKVKWLCSTPALIWPGEMNWLYTNGDMTCCALVLVWMVIWTCSEPALDWNGDMNLLCTSAWLQWWYEFILADAWLKCVLCIADFLCHTELSAEAVWLFSGYRRELALFNEVFLTWFVVTTRVAMSQANLLMTWTWNVEQGNIGCRSSPGC